MKRAWSILVVVALSLAGSASLRAEDAVRPRVPAREAFAAAIRAGSYQVSCGVASPLELCGFSRQYALAYQLDPGRDTYEYNVFQRLAGMIADRMDAGSWRNVKLRFKIILE